MPRKLEETMHRPAVGISIWDHGERSFHEGNYYRLPPDFYREVLERKLCIYRDCFDVLELSQEAAFGGEGGVTWSRLDPYSVRGFLPVLVDGNRWLSVHLRHGGVDLAEPDREHFRQQSVKEDEFALRWAFSLGADAAVLHPGTYNVNVGRFWPSADELQEHLEARSAALEKSLAELVAVYVEMVLEYERMRNDYYEAHHAVVRDLEALFGDLEAIPRTDGRRYAVVAELLRILEKEQVPLFVLRHCMKGASKGMRLCLENLEPPNFLVCTPVQLEKWFSRLLEMYHEAAGHRGLDGALLERYRPGISLDVNHLLNTKMMMEQPGNSSYRMRLEGEEQLSLPFVNLPGEYPLLEGRPQEPLLNKVMRLLGSDVALVHISGSSRMDSCMTTHEPVKPLRERVVFELDERMVPFPRYKMNCFRPDHELNIEEVVQVVGPGAHYVAEIHDFPEELVRSSVINLSCYLSYFMELEEDARSLLTRRLREEAASLDGCRRSGDGGGDAVLSSKRREALLSVLTRLESASCYVRPRRGTDLLWEVGYEEIGFYDDPAGNGEIEIFATVKEDREHVWVKDLIADEG